MNSLNAFAIVVPTIAVLIGILLNRQDATAIRSELKNVEIALRNEFNLQIGSLRAEMKSENNSLRAEMVQLRNGIHHDMVGLHERIAVVEAKQSE